MLEILCSSRCADCGLADPAVLEFDHVGPKRLEVGRLVREGYRLERIKVEIANCELVCANCHRRRTAERCRSWRVDPGVEELRVLSAAAPEESALLRDYLHEHPCRKCGESDPVVLDFHHTGSKTAGVVQLAGHECALSVLEREIAACEVLCGNCHRRETIVDQQHFRNHLVTPP